MLRSNRSIIKFLFQSCKSGSMIALNSRFRVHSLCSQHMIDSVTSFWVRKRASQKQKVTQHAKRCWVALASTATRWKCVASSVTQQILWDSHSVEPQSEPGVVIYRNSNSMAISMLRLWKGHADGSSDIELAGSCTGLWQRTLSQDGWRSSWKRTTSISRKAVLDFLFLWKSMVCIS